MMEASFLSLRTCFVITHLMLGAGCGSLYYLHIPSSKSLTTFLLFFVYHLHTFFFQTKRALIVGKDYPHPDGLDYVRRKWKEALRDPTNCQLINDGTSPDIDKENERIIRKAVGRGRYVSKV